MSKINLRKVIALLAVAGFMGACSNGGSSDGNSGYHAPDTTTTAPESGAAGFSATHAGSFEITGWAGNSLTDVMSVEDLDARVADFEGLSLAIDTLSSMGMAEGRHYEFDRAGNELHLYAGGHTLIINGDSATLSADDSAAVAGDQGQGQAQMTKEAPRSVPCRLYREEVKEEKQEEQGGKEVTKGEQGQAGEQGDKSAPAEEQGQAGEQGQSQEQNQVQEVQQPEDVIVRCEETLTTEQEQGQSQAQVKPESRTEIIHVVLNLTPEEKEVKQEQVVEKEVKQEETKVEQKQEETKEVKQEQKQEVKEEKAPVKEEKAVEQKQEVKEEKAPVKEEKKEVKEEKQEQKGEAKQEGKTEEKKPGQGQG
jgi:hypothetical protein